MKQLLIAAALLCVCTTPSFAAKLVYLKDGGVIKAQKVWRSEGKVHVLVNRDTLADFNNSEVNLKKTFVKKRSGAKSSKQAVVTPAAVTAAAKTTAAQQEKKKTGISIPTMPALPEKSPEALAGKEEGSIRKHKREMSEKSGE